MTSLPGRAGLTLLLLVLWCTAYTLNFSRSYRPDDDNMYYYYISARLENPARATTAEQSLNRHLEDIGADSWIRHREKIRSTTPHHYTLASHLWLRLGGTPALNDPATLTGQMASAFYWTNLLLGLIFLSAVGLVAGPLGLGATAGALALASLSQLLPERGYWLALEAGATTPLTLHTVFGGSFWRNALLFALHLPDAFSMFSFSPRGISALLALGIFLLRWHGHVLTAYAMLVPFMLVHQSNAALLLAMMAVIDLIAQPGLIRQPRRLGVMILTAVLVVGGQSLFEVMTGSPGRLLLLLAGASAALALAIWLLTRLSGPLARWEGFWQRFSPPVRDALLIGLVWLASMPAVRFIAIWQYDFVTGRHFWWQLHTRLAGLLVGVILLAVCLTLLRRLTDRYGSRAAGAAVTLLLGVGLIAQALQPGHLAIPAGPDATGRAPVVMYAYKAGVCAAQQGALPASQHDQFAFEAVWQYALMQHVAGNPRYDRCLGLTTETP